MFDIYQNKITLYWFFGNIVIASLRSGILLCRISIECLQFNVSLPPAYVVRQKGKIFTGVHLSTGKKGRTGIPAMTGVAPCLPPLAITGVPSLPSPLSAPTPNQDKARTVVQRRRYASCVHSEVLSFFHLICMLSFCGCTCVTVSTSGHVYPWL